MKKTRRRLVHLLTLETRAPLCGGDGAEASSAALHGVAICAVCARRMAEQVERTPERPAAPSPVRS